MFYVFTFCPTQRYPSFVFIIDDITRVCVWEKSVPSIIFHAIYGPVCIQLTYSPYDDCDNTCTLSYYHHQIWSMSHLPLFMVRSWNNGMRCMSFYILFGTVRSLLCHNAKFKGTRLCKLNLGVNYGKLLMIFNSFGWLWKVYGESDRKLPGRW